MAIAAPSVGTMLQDDTNTSHSLAAPANVDDGRLLIVCCGLENQAESITGPGGFTQRANFNTTTGADRSLAVFSKIASSESGTYDWSHSTSAQGWGVVLSYPGVDSTTSVEATTTVVHENDDTPAPADATVTTEDAWGVLIAWKGGGASTELGTPTNATQRASANTAAWTLHVADEGSLSSGTYNPNDFTGAGSAGDSLIATLILRPEAAATGNPWYYYANQ